MDDDNSIAKPVFMFAAAFQKALAPANQMGWAEAFIVSGVALVLVLPMIAALYLVKSAVGINLMNGPSPLHDLLYQFVR